MSLMMNTCDNDKLSTAPPPSSSFSSQPTWISSSSDEKDHYDHDGVPIDSNHDDGSVDDKPNPPPSPFMEEVEDIEGTSFDQAAIASNSSDNGGNFLTNMYYKYIYGIATCLCGSACWCTSTKVSEKKCIKFLIGFVILVALVVPSCVIAFYLRDPGTVTFEGTTIQDPVSSTIVLEDGDREKYYGLIIKILEQVIKGGNLFQDDPTLTSTGLKIDLRSTTGHALEWLAYKDQDLDLISNVLQNNDIENTLPPYYEQRIVQRFALVAFYLGVNIGIIDAVSGSDKWIQEPLGWTAKHECDWMGVTCNWITDIHGIVTDLKLYGRGSKLTLTSSAGIGLPTELAMLTNLKHLDLSNNKLEGNFPPQEWMASLVNLEKLKVQNNDKLSGEFADLIQSFPNLQYLDLSDTKIGGTIPETGPAHIAGTSSNLQVLKAATTPKLAGTIPTELGTIWGANLQKLVLSRNDLSGSLPTQLGLLTKLTKLQIDHTPNMGSSLPTEVGLLTGLEFLDFKYINLQGTLPTEYEQLTNLIWLDLSGNYDLSGTFPEEYSAMTTLEQVHIMSNSLSGTISRDFCDLGLKDFQADCLNGKIECSCCTACFP